MGEIESIGAIKPEKGSTSPDEYVRQGNKGDRIAPGSHGLKFRELFKRTHVANR